MLIYLLAFATLAGAAEYECATEFGETVPLSLQKSQGAGRRWNENARNAPGRSEVHQRSFERGTDRAELETRYLTRSGPSFGLRIRCPGGEGKCRGAFANGSSTLLLATNLSDERTPATGLAELKLGSREHLGLIVRVKKTAVAAARGTTPVSASGELKIYREDPLFIQDVGADEAMILGPEWYARIAALEIKIRCHRAD